MVAALAIVQVAACPADAAGRVLDRGIAKFFRNCQRAHGFFSIYMTLAGVLAMVLTATLPRLLAARERRAARARVAGRAWWPWR